MKLWVRTHIRDARASFQDAPTRARLLNVAALGIGLGVALALRVPLLGFRSVDYFKARIQLYPLIQQAGFSALASSASNYNPPFFYVLYIVSRLLPSLPMDAAVKLPAILADFICALFVLLIVRLQHPRGLMAAWAAVAVVLAPTVVANASLWGQVDSIHTAGILACIYFLMRRQPGLAFVCYSVALAFKLQSIFLAPLLLALWLRRDVSWKPFLIIPTTLLVALLPAWLAGRPWTDLVTIYWDQAAQYESLTMHAPSIFSWLPSSTRVFNMLYVPGLLTGAAVAFLLTVVVYKAPATVRGTLLLETALLCMLIVPFFLPKMHERYFFPADVLSIAFAFYDVRWAWVSIAVVGVSSLSYLPFLFGIEVIPLFWLTAALLLVICAVGYDCMRRLYSRSDAEEASGPASASPLAGVL
jgi:Gpi18-like mannosyltransferase